MPLAKPSTRDASPERDGGPDYSLESKPLIEITFSGFPYTAGI